MSAYVIRGMFGGSNALYLADATKVQGKWANRASAIELSAAEATAFVAMFEQAYDHNIWTVSVEPA